MDCDSFGKNSLVLSLILCHNNCVLAPIMNGISGMTDHEKPMTGKGKHNTISSTIFPQQYCSLASSNLVPVFDSQGIT